MKSGITSLTYVKMFDVSQKLSVKATVFVSFLLSVMAKGINFAPENTDNVQRGI
jgi:hypothetical protein